MKTETGTEKKVGGRMRLGSKISLLVALMLGTSIIVVTVLSVSLFYNLTIDILEDQCVNGTNILAYQLQVNGNSGDLNGMLDDLKEQTDCEFTIFQGDERAYTTIQQNGERAVGTRLSADLAAIVLERGQSYVGRADILGVEHLCSYVPTKGPDGQINGLIFAGISLESALRQVSLTIMLTCLAGLVLIILDILWMLRHIRHSVTQPLTQLTRLAGDMEQGNLGLDGRKKEAVTVRSHDEIGFLANAMEGTVRRVSGYIQEIALVLDAVSRGDLTVRPEQTYIGDYASIRRSLDEILQQLNRTMREIDRAADQVADGSDQVSNGAQSLARGATEQASSVEELAASVSEISRQVETTADHAENARAENVRSHEQIQVCSGHMDELVRAMELMEEKSHEIEKVIKAIDDIAFQTNILALNAAVEAARAGEAGKGFAVVADEVRSLAGKSGEAAKGTTVLIEETVRAISEGVRLSGETDGALREVMDSARKVLDAVTLIADAAKEQSQAVSQVSQGIDQISNVVQTNSATAEESAAASEELSGQAALLKAQVGRFKLLGA